MRVAILSPIAWRTPPRHYGPWERVASLLTEGLVKEKIDVTLYATGESIATLILKLSPHHYFILLLRFVSLQVFFIFIFSQISLNLTVYLVHHGFLS